MEAANAVLESWTDGAPESGNEQCDIQIIFEDGFEYHGRYRLNKSQKRISLSRYVRKQLAELAAARNGDTSSEADDESVISLIGNDRAESARIALDRYNI